MPLIQSFTRRAWRQQKLTAVGFSAAAGVVLGISAVAMTGGVHGVSQADFAFVSSIVSVRSSSGEILPISEFLIVLCTVAVGVVLPTLTTFITPGVVADDTRGGGLEVLLAGPTPRRRLFSSYLGACMILTGLCWLIVTASFVASLMITAAVLHLDVVPGTQLVVTLALFPLAMALWSACVTLYGALLHPSSLESVAGLNGGPIRLAALVLPLIALMAATFSLTHIAIVIAAVSVLAILASIAVLALTVRGFNGAAVLTT